MYNVLPGVQLAAQQVLAVLGTAPRLEAHGVVSGLDVIDGSSPAQQRVTVNND
jgi:hypothetical protein